MTWRHELSPHSSQFPIDLCVHGSSGAGPYWQKTWQQRSASARCGSGCGPFVRTLRCSGPRHRPICASRRPRTTDRHHAIKREIWAKRKPSRKRFLLMSTEKQSNWALLTQYFRCNVALDVAERWNGPYLSVPNVNGERDGNAINIYWFGFCFERNSWRSQNAKPKP